MSESDNTETSPVPEGAKSAFAAANGTNGHGQINVAIIGAGSVGVFTAIEVAKNGARVSLVSRPGSQTLQALKQQKYIELASTKTTREIDAMFEAKGNYISPPAEISDIPQDDDLTEVIGDKRVISHGKLADKLKKMGNAVGNELFGAVNAQTQKEYFTQGEIHTLLTKHLRIPLYVQERDGDEEAYRKALGSTRYVKLFDNIKDAEPENQVIIVATKSFSKSAEFAKRTVLPFLAENGVVVDLSNGLKRSSIPKLERTNLRQTLHEALTESDVLADLNAFEDEIGPERIIGANALFAVEAEKNSPHRVHVRSLLHTAAIYTANTNPYVERIFEGSDIRPSTPHDPLAQSLDKLGINMMNIMSAVYDKSKAEVFSNQTLLNLYNNALRELYRVAETGYGVTLHRGGPEAYVEHCQRYHRRAVLAASHAGDIHRSSTHKDIAEGKAKTEREFLLDAIIELSDKQKIQVPHLRILSSFMDTIEELIKENQLDELRKQHYIFYENTHEMRDGTVTRVHPPKTSKDVELPNVGTVVTSCKMPFFEWRRLHNNRPDYFKNIMPQLLHAVDSNHTVFKNGKCVELMQAFVDSKDVNPETGEINLESSAFNVFWETIKTYKEQWDAYTAAKKNDEKPEEKPEAKRKRVELAWQAVNDAKNELEQRYRNARTLTNNRGGAGTGGATTITADFTHANDDANPWLNKKRGVRKILPKYSTFDGPYSTFDGPGCF